MATNSFEQPGDFPVVTESRYATQVWLQWFTRVHNAVASLYQSGTTANRPTALLWVGRMYYDTTLGYPVWVHSVKPAVWHNAAGAVV
jgi:hypothetical protein